MQRLIKNQKGQVMLITVLGIVLMIIAVTPLLTYIRLSSNDEDSDFRIQVSQISLNFKEALSISLSEVSQALELKSSATRYLNYTNLEEYPAAEIIGSEFLADWHNETALQYSGKGLKINISNTQFDCVWSSFPFYSQADAIINFDILTYGFEGWKYQTLIESNLNILGLDQRDGNYTSFFFSLSRENALPIKDLEKTFIKIYYNSTSGKFRYADSNLIKLYNVGDGKYLLKFSSPYMSDPPRIKMLLQDSRGVIVGALPSEGVVLTATEDQMGPQTLNLNYNPKPVNVDSSFTLTGTVDDSESGWSYIAAAEYFINSTGANGTGTSISAADGQFDAYSENIEANINVTGWAVGNHTLYVHGLDTEGNWGNFTSIIVEVVDQQIMYIYRIDMSVEVDWFLFWRRIRALATITVYDTGSNPVENADVSGTWSGATSDEDWGLTNVNGQVTMKSDWVWYWGSEPLTFTFTVDNVQKNNWIYNSELNNETSDTIEYP